MEEIRDPGTVTFNDVAVYFSQRDWQLLADWQRKLYQNIMKEIHGALTALGYEIANPGTLVKIQQHEEPYFRDELSKEEMAASAWVSHDDDLQERMADVSDSVPQLPSIKPDILLRVKMEGVTSERSNQTPAPKMEEESKDPDNAVFNPELALWIKQEEAHSFPGKEDGTLPAVEALSQHIQTEGTHWTKAGSLPKPSRDKPAVHKRNGLKLREKILVLCAFENKESVGSLATQFGVSRAQIVQIIKRREELLEALQNNVSGDRIRRQRRTANDRVNSAVWDWLLSIRGTGITLSGRIIQDKALQVARDMGIQDFKASNGWLESFKKTHNIHRSSSSSSMMEFGDCRMDEWLASFSTTDR
ncbi:uncharacterized protein LOC143989168 isoform X3 [Lithobates pipiens]